MGRERGSLMNSILVRNSFVDLGLLREIAGGARHRVFQYDPYVAIFGELKP